MLLFSPYLAPTATTAAYLHGGLTASYTASHSFNYGAEYPRNRIGALIFLGNNTISNVQIGGQSATQQAIVDTGSYRWYFYDAVMPTAFANSGITTFTSSGATNRAAAWMYDLPTLTFVSSASDAYANQNPVVLTQSLNSGGSLIGAALNVGSANSTTTGGFTERFDGQVQSTLYATVADLLNTGSSGSQTFEMNWGANQFSFGLSVVYE